MIIVFEEVSWTECCDHNITDRFAAFALEKKEKKIVDILAVNLGDPPPDGKRGKWGGCVVCYVRVWCACVMCGVLVWCDDVSCVCVWCDDVMYACGVLVWWSYGMCMSCACVWCNYVMCSCGMLVWCTDVMWFCGVYLWCACVCGGACLVCPRASRPSPPSTTPMANSFFFVWNEQVCAWDGRRAVLTLMLFWIVRWIYLKS